MTKDEEIRVVALDRARLDLPMCPLAEVLERADRYYWFLRVGTVTIRPDAVT